MEGRVVPVGLIGPSEIERQILINQCVILTALAGLPIRPAILLLMNDAADNTAKLLGTNSPEKEETEPEDKWYRYCGKDGMTCRNCFHAKMLEKWICQEHRGKQTQPYQSCKDWAGKTHPDGEC